MSRNTLYAVLALILAAELQLTSCQEGVTSQHDNSSLPVSYSATVLEGGGRVCPPEEQLETLHDPTIRRYPANYLSTLYYCEPAYNLHSLLTQSHLIRIAITGSFRAIAMATTGYPVVHGN